MKYKGMVLAETMLAMAISVIAIGLLFESFNLLIRSKMNFENISNNKKCIYSVEQEIRNEMTCKELSDLFEQKGENIMLIADNKLLEDLCTNNFYNILVKKGKTYEEEYKNNNLIFKFTLLENNQNGMKIQFTAQTKGGKLQEEIYKSSWKDYV